jgi:hypothetical protein
VEKEPGACAKPAKEEVNDAVPRRSSLTPATPFDYITGLARHSTDTSVSASPRPQAPGEPPPCLPFPALCPAVR